MIRCGVQAGLEAKWEREVVEDSEKVEDQGIAYYFKHFKYITQHGATEDEILGVSSCHQRSNNFFFYSLSYQQFWEILLSFSMGVFQDSKHSRGMFHLKHHSGKILSSV